MDPVSSGETSYESIGFCSVTGAAFDTETIETREPYSRDQDTGIAPPPVHCKTISHLLIYDLALHHDFYNCFLIY